MMIKNMDLISKMLEASARKNVLPLTSRCNFNCVFCSHAGNPEGVLAFRFPDISMELAEEMSEKYDPSHKLVIGESATRLMEGEPLLHPFFFDILNMVRGKYPDMLFQLTTNGSLLDRDCVRRLSLLQPLEINLSINSADPYVRRKLLGDRRENAAAVPALLKEHGISYHGSIVMVPELTGWDDIGKTIACLDVSGALSVRLFLPGYTSFSQNKYQVSLDELAAKIASWSERYAVPLIYEPARLNDLSCNLLGVSKGSAADRCCLERGDIIMSVNGCRPSCRKDAFDMALEARNPQVLVKRKNSGVFQDVLLEKNAGESSGMVFHFDIDTGRMARVMNRIRRGKYRHVLLLASELAYGVLDSYFRTVFEHRSGKERQVEVRVVQNIFFGGSIACAGLLTVHDFLSAVQGEVEHDAIIVPAEAFDGEGLDMSGTPSSELERKLKVPVLIL